MAPCLLLQAPFSPASPSLPTRQPPAAFHVSPLGTPSSPRAFTHAVPSTSLLSPSPPPLLQLTPTQPSCLRNQTSSGNPSPAPDWTSSPGGCPACSLVTLFHHHHHHHHLFLWICFWPRSGIELPPPEWEAQSLNRWTTREVPSPFVVMLSGVDNDNNS